MWPRQLTPARGIYYLLHLGNRLLARLARRPARLPRGCRECDRGCPEDVENAIAAAPRMSRMRSRLASETYLRNFGRASTSRISDATAADRQMVSCDRARNNARSGIECSLSAAPIIELASKTTFGIVGG